MVNSIEFNNDELELLYLITKENNDIPKVLIEKFQKALEYKQNQIKLDEEKKSSMLMKYNSDPFLQKLYQTVCIEWNDFSILDFMEGIENYYFLIFDNISDWFNSYMDNDESYFIKLDFKNFVERDIKLNSETTVIEAFFNYQKEIDSRIHLLNGKIILVQY